MKLTKIVDQLIDKSLVPGTIRNADLIGLLALARRKAEDLERYEAGEVAFKGLTLGELIDKLKQCQLDDLLRYDWPGGSVVCGVESYRGYYEDLALGYADEDEARFKHRQASPEGPSPLTAGGVLALLEGAVGSTFTGWKGGEFVMDRDTRVWVDNPGDCHGVAVVDVTFDGRSALIRTWRTE